MKISARVVQDSKNIETGNRITSIVVTMPRFILAELNTHRLFSKNSASSRAKPFKSVVKTLTSEGGLFIPIAFMKDHSGMQGSEYFKEGETGTESKDVFLKRLKDIYRVLPYTKEVSDEDMDHIGEELIKMSATPNQLWQIGFSNILTFAITLHSMGVSKQITNRLLEPFSWHDVLITSTEWDNFIALRNHPDAEIHIIELANVVLNALNDSTPVELKPGEYHMPYNNNVDDSEVEKLISTNPSFKDYTLSQAKIAIATARAARISYKTFDGTINYESDLNLYTRLVVSKPIHASPTEHIAKAMSKEEASDKYYKVENGVKQEGWCRNFRGFIQHRVDIDQDTVWEDQRIVKK